MKKPTLKTTSGSGFSLVELLVVIAVIAIIAAIAIPNIANITSAAGEAKNQRNAQNIASTYSAARAAGYSGGNVTDIAGAIAALTADNGRGITYTPAGSAEDMFFGIGTLTQEEIDGASGYLVWDSTMNTVRYNAAGGGEAEPSPTP